MRKIILSVLGLVIILLSVFLANKIIESNTRKRPVPNKVVKTVFVDTVSNGTVPINIKASGSLTAKRRLELYTEVQGILLGGKKLFKPGQTYRRGELLLRLDASEFYASVQSQRSNLYNQIAAIMPDIRLDYPESFDKWQNYLTAFDINKSLAPLPEFSSDKERYFINGRNITTSYYTIKNLEQRLSKFSITAPFDGILTEALVTEGTLVRSGQKLGEYIDTGVYELPVAVNKSYADMLAIGKKVTIRSLDDAREYEGVVSRINGNVDVSSQTIDAFIEVKDENLREGVYLEANLEAREETNAYVLSRALLQSETEIFSVRDTILELINVRPIYFTDKTVVVKGIPDGSIILKRPVPGAYEGMLVKIFEESANSSDKETAQSSQ
ncbi:MAG: efflux RND transporter periplasmic adaptor subunit [Bacteroidia bacterium]|nr:efflux RND transporter periplasmic adaptor subunit [Bacteroidia bacterium]NNM23592.1 efflux RND transporter periplasmic adaptor subunit [Flavobacteriaceae bacterium]